MLYQLSYTRWQAGQDSNPQPAVLETAALPIELPPSNTDVNDIDAGSVCQKWP